MYYDKINEKFNQFFKKKYYNFFFSFCLVNHVDSRVNGEYLDFIKILINRLSLNLICGNISISRTSDRILHQGHKPVRIMYDHRVYRFDRDSRSDIKTLLIS